MELENKHRRLQQADEGMSNWNQSDQTVLILQIIGPTLGFIAAVVLACVCWPLGLLVSVIHTSILQTRCLAGLCGMRVS